MMNTFEAADCLLENLPELALSVTGTGRPLSIYKLIAAFFQVTCARVKDHNYTEAKTCFKLADRLYEEGSAAVKGAMENIFIFSLDNLFFRAKKERMEIRGLIPGSLYSAYMRQVMHAGC